LILDDTQVITNRQIFKGLFYLIDFLPSKLHMIVIGRAELGHGLAGYPLKSDFFSIGVGDLRFRREEIGAFFKIMEVDVGSSDIQKLETLYRAGRRRWWPRAFHGKRARRSGSGGRHIRSITASVNTS
jgi:ATP/maltotriose-dependent transcriptional regulator MalT